MSVKQVEHIYALMSEQDTRADRLDHPSPSLCLSGKLEGTGSLLVEKPFILGSSQLPGEVVPKLITQQFGSCKWSEDQCGVCPLRFET